MTDDERKVLIDALRPHLADYYERPFAYEFDFFHNSWAEKLHAAACNLAASRQRPALNGKHVDAFVGAAVAHWSSLGNDWRPPRDLTSGEWDDLAAIAHGVGVRNIPGRRRHFSDGTQ